MSLLIKALANAEKDKQAERDKKSAETGLPLELAPKEELKLSGDAQSAAQKKTDVQLSLEEEAGLGAIPVTAKKIELEKKTLEKGLNQTVAQSGSSQYTQAEVKTASKTTDRVQPQSTAPILDSNQKTAAKVFVANQSAKSPTSIGTLLLLGVGGAMFAWLGLQGYTYFTKPAPVVATVTSQSPPPTKPNIAEKTLEPSVVESKPEDTQPTSQETPTSETIELRDDAVAGNFPSKELLTKRQVKVQKSVASTLTVNELSQGEEAPTKKERNTQKQTSLKLISKSSSTSVDPTLLAAYQAYTRGEDASAQQQYRLVLQHDVRNVDALLGMAAIAQRQGREADAAGWYQKVIEVDPQNSIAQTALVSPQAGADITNAESRIKNLLANQPEAAHLHAALGNFYAKQNQWASAQAAYFDACRFAPNNADYAFNLAVSLEQVGKQKLALAQYQRALELLNQLGGTSPDRAILEARIQALQ